MVLNAVAFMFGCGLATKLISSDKGANSSMARISRRYTSASALSSGDGSSPFGVPVPLNGNGASTVMELLLISGTDALPVRTDPEVLEALGFEVSLLGSPLPDRPSYCLLLEVANRLWNSLSFLSALLMVNTIWPI